MYSEFATDPKVQMLDEVDQRRYVMLLCLRCGNGDVTLPDNEVAFQLRIDNADWAETKAVLLERNLITNSNQPTSWDKRQYASDTSAARVAAHRARKKQGCNVTATPPDTDTDTDKTHSTTDVVLVAGKPADPCPHQEIIDLYHRILPMGRQVKVWNEPRRAKLRARWREDIKRQSVDWWERFFGYIANSEFLTGQTTTAGRPPFEIDLEWIVTAANMVKIVEGKYHQREVTA